MTLQIVESARSVQSVMVEREKLLETALVHESTFHITLAVIHLSSPQEHVEYVTSTGGCCIPILHYTLIAFQ